MRDGGRLRIVAVVTGIVGILLCALVPLLPVRQSTATIVWPQGGVSGDVTAPLVSGAPLSMTVSVPCAAIATLPADGGLVLSTIPPEGIDASRNGLFVRADAESVVVAVRDTVAAVAPRAAVDAGACEALRIDAGPGGIVTDFAGIPGAASTLPAELKPQVAGLFTDLRVPAEPGLAVRVDVDTRFVSSPTALKRLATVLGVLAVAASVVALALLDGPRRGAAIGSSRRAAMAGVPARRRWRTPAGRAALGSDVVVIGTLLLWHVIGAQSTDDGYNTTVARVATDAGYSADYYRFFGASAAPFDWYASVLSAMTAVSTHGVWLRLPATLAALGTWLLLSRRVLPRLGRGIVGDRWAVWTAAAVFLAAWLPFNNGLRPEPLVAVATLAVWALVENAVATRRLWPVAAGVVVAVLAVTTAPQGLVALAPLLAGARAVARVVTARRATHGRAAPVVVLLAAASLLFAVVFRDQTLAAVAESARIRYVVGPTLAWYQEFLRYYWLTVEDSPDGSLTRRFSVLVLLLCLAGAVAVLLRRGRIPGVANGPVWRLLGTAAVGLALLAFTPTKWVVQFGGFAGVAGALGAVTALALARVGLHSRRNLAIYVAALLFVLAWATAGINGWFYTANYGVPWFDRQPVIAGQPVTSMFLAAAIGVALLAGWLHFRLDFAGHTEVRDTRRNRMLASTPLLAVAVVMVVLQVSSMAKATAGRWPVYTDGRANIAALVGSSSCGIADDVLVEPDVDAGMLTAVAGQPVGAFGPLGGEDPVGFDPNAVNDNLEPLDAQVANPGTVNSDGSPNKAYTGIGFAAGTGGGYGPQGVNGSRVFLPYGLDPARTPVMGSFDENTVAASVTSSWYALPPRSPQRPLVVVAAAGAIRSYNEDGVFNYGQSLTLEWGRTDPDGGFTALGGAEPIDIAPRREWRNLRFPLDAAPPDADVVRIVADDPNLSSDQWFAFTPPRVPVLETAQTLLGRDTPVLLDIATAADFPCQRPATQRLGIAELPEFRVIPNHKQMVTSSNLWQSAEDGGPFLYIQALLRPTAIPSYLRGDWYRDWGAVERYERLVPAAQAPEAVVEQGTLTRWGVSRGGPIRALP